MSKEFKQKLNPRTGQFNLIPTNVVIEFKPGVATHNDLPLVANEKGDARIANDTGHLYVWTLESATGLLTDWADAGDIVDLKWAAIEDKPSSAVADIDDAVSKRHTQETDKYLTTQVTNVLYVDGNRTDTYTANGSITKPFKKIQDAIDAVTSPSAANKYVIEIAPGAYYSDAISINKVYVTFRSCGVQGARISGAITITNPGDPTPEQITFVGLRISGGLTCLASHIAINCIDCNVTGTAWTMNPTVPTDDEYLQVWGGLFYANCNLTNVYTYLMGGGYYSTFTATNKEFNINNADINDPFQVTLNGTIIASAYGDRAGNSKFIVNAGATLNIDADTEGGSVLTLDPLAILNRTTKAANIVNTPAGTIVATNIQAAIDELDTEKTTLADVKADLDIADAISKKHDPGSDNQDASQVPTDDSGISVQDALDALEGKIATESITYYIDCDSGSNANPGTVSEPFQTIQYAIDLLPKILLDKQVNIRLKSSLNYNEEPIFDGFQGGIITLRSDSDNADDVLITLNIGYGIQQQRCSTLLYVRKISVRITVEDGQCFYADRNSSMILRGCKLSDNDNTISTGILCGKNSKITVKSDVTNYDSKKVVYEYATFEGGVIIKEESPSFGDNENNPGYYSFVINPDDLNDAVSKRHDPGSDNQDASQVPTEDSGISVQDALNAVEANIHTQNTDNQIILNNSPDNLTASGTKLYITAHEAMAFGDVCRINADGEAQIAKADVIANANAIVMCVEESISADDSGAFLILGVARNDSWAWNVGGLIYLSTTGTSGNTLTQVAPSGANNVIQILGIGAGSMIILTPNLVQIEHT